MALEAIIFQQEFSYNNKDLYNLLESNWSDYETSFHQLLEEEKNSSLGYFLENQTENYYDYFDHGEYDGNYWQHSISTVPQHNQSSTAQLSEADDGCREIVAVSEEAASENGPIKRRRRSKSRRNKEEMENQRMTHIAVERNRRKQMNEYLSVLRSLMPQSYVQRGDQASIIGGAINYVKELEHKLHNVHHKESTSETSPFTEFFTSPQYSTTTTTNETAVVAAADIEVTMVESHACLKIRSKKIPKQLFKMVSGLKSLRLTTLHLNVTTTVDQIVMYSLSVKVEDDCKLTSVDDIATAVHQLICKIRDDHPS